jgi:hypothetical protein
MLGSAQTSIAAEFDGQLCQFAGICAELWKELPERAETEMLHESSKSRALVKVLWRAGPFDISLYPRCIIFLKRRAKQQSSALYLYMMQAVKQTPTRLYFKPPPLSIKPHYIMTRARARHADDIALSASSTFFRIMNVIRFFQLKRNFCHFSPSRRFYSAR